MKLLNIQSVSSIIHLIFSGKDIKAGIQNSKRNIVVNGTDDPEDEEPGFWASVLQKILKTQTNPKPTKTQKISNTVLIKHYLRIVFSTDNWPLKIKWKLDG